MTLTDIKYGKKQSGRQCSCLTSTYGGCGHNKCIIKNMSVFYVFNHNMRASQQKIIFRRHLSCYRYLVPGEL